MLYVNLLPTAWLLFFFLSLFGAELMRYSSGLQHALCASGIGGSGAGGGGEHIKAWNEGEEAEALVMRRKRERAMTAVWPQAFFAVAAVKWRWEQKPHFSIFDHGYYWCVCYVNLHHLMFPLSPNRIKWDGIVFLCNLSTFWHLHLHRTFSTTAMTHHIISQTTTLLFPPSCPNTNSIRPTWPRFRCISNPLHYGICLFGL